MGAYYWKDICARDLGGLISGGLFLVGGGGAHYWNLR